MYKFLFWILLFGIAPALPAGLDSKYWVNFGVGMPQLASLEAAWHPLPRWQLGLSYGAIPGGGKGGTISPSYTLPSQNITLSTGAHIQIHDPTITSTFQSICPYVRFFPNDNGFYLQFTMGIMKVNNDLKSDLYDITGNKITDADYSGQVIVTQYFPTIAIGHVFNSELFYFSLNMGITVVANLDADVRLKGKLPDSMGGNEANESVLQNLDTQNRQVLSRASEEFRKQVSFLPSIQLLFGMMF